MKGRKTAKAARKRRHIRVRKKVVGTAQQPRLAVFRSLSHIYAQVVDDDASHTLVSASDMEKAVNAGKKDGPKTKVAAAVGSLVGQRAIEKGITQVVFDRGGCRYHGRVKALAEAAREAGLKL